MMRNAILTAVSRRHDLEVRLAYSDDHITQLCEDGAVVEAPEEVTLLEAIGLLRSIKDQVLVLPANYHPSRTEMERGLKDKTEAYDGLDYPRRVQAAIRAHNKGSDDVSKLLKEKEEKQNRLTKEIVHELEMAPTAFYPFMMADPHPLPEEGTGLPRAREAAREPRGSVGYSFRTLDRPYFTIQNPWYILVEGGMNVARRFLHTHKGAGLREEANLIVDEVAAASCGVDVREHPNGTFYLDGWHHGFPGSESAGYGFRLNRVAFGPTKSQTAGLQEWLNPIGALYAYCGCGDFEHRSRKNRYQAFRDREENVGTIKPCKHLTSASYWMMGIGTHGIDNHSWHSSIFLLPLQEQGKQRFSEALRLRHLLTTRLLVRDEHGSAEPATMMTQNLLYGAINQALHSERGFGLFQPGVMNFARLQNLAREEARLLRDPVYQRT